ncbi:hypothetical protein OWV82_017306 [Melia azedarach]|uniref:Uncharacterized protein n=1 Tax=Melia azedarach TaxID=155640 RepID=A0ACC1XKJ3_MELAZ|nr:hypothetical protein OWV82_017306 [Melia azedarach]
MAKEHQPHIYYVQKLGWFALLIEKLKRVEKKSQNSMNSQQLELACCHGPPKRTRDHRKLKSTTTRFSLDQRAQIPDSTTFLKRSANSRINSTRADNRHVKSEMAEARSCAELSGVCAMHAQLPTTSSTGARKMGRSWVAVSGPYWLT